MNKQSKHDLVAELAEQLKGTKAAFLADYRGLNVEKATELRRKLRAAGVEYRVVKNTLLRLAARGTPVASALVAHAHELPTGGAHRGALGLASEEGHATSRRGW